MNDLAIITRAINNVMNKHLAENKYLDHIVFEAKPMVTTSSTMFTMNMTSGRERIEPFKLVFLNEFIEACDEDDAVRMICDLFIKVINQFEKNMHAAEKEIKDVSDLKL